MQILERDDKDFPKKLLAIKPEIEKLYVQGNVEILNEFGLAVIGSRNMSKEGGKITENLVSKLSPYKINIISGLAKGIDSVAHKKCIISGGKTIAVLGSGFNKIFPKENIKLYEEIIKTGGAVITEYPPNEGAKSDNFPKRNRIVSGLSDGVIVIEGKQRSGTTITAELARKQGKPIFCVPHSIYNSYGAAPNEQIRKGGILILNHENILSYYSDKIKLRKKEKINYENEILKLLSEEELTKEELSIKLNKSISEINQEITLLELEGIIEETIAKGYKINEY